MSSSSKVVVVVVGGGGLKPPSPPDSAVPVPKLLALELPVENNALVQH